ncbi:MAG: Gfo/Idh/MocA family oxidoreductase [Kiritimatiellae bacterium]|nr:Gfo/Idh/MocA family oxidoreductase [Kiritimatiellia bacterium]
MRVSRRGFVKVSGGTLSLFSILPRRLLAGSGETPPSETVRVASIGCAGRPCADINGLAGAGAKIVGLCDVDTRRIDGMRKKYPEAPFFGDYREMLDKLDKQIDAVIVGTPDHWHAAQAIECLKRGKHVQCEKPLAQSFAEVEKMMAVAKESKLVNQAMNQGHAYDTLRDFREWVEAGIIGNVTEAHIWTPAVYSFMDQLPEMKKHWDIPKELDWERWQGPVPRRPYFPKYLPGAWRFWTAYGTYTLGDWSCHLMDPLFWTFGLGFPHAVKSEIIGDWDPEIHGATFPKGAVTTMEFTKRDGSPFTLKWFDGLGRDKVPVPPGFGDDMKKFPPKCDPEYRKTVDNMVEGAFVYGDKGVIQYAHHGAIYLKVLPESRMVQLRNDNALPPKKYPRVPNGSPFVEFLNAVRGGTPVGSDFAYAGAMSQTALVAIAAMFDPGKRLTWDVAKHEFSNSSAANRHIRAERLPGYGV